MGDSRLTFNMRCFDEFIRESGLMDPPLRNAAFTWSNMQVVHICKRLDRFKNMWLFHPEFKEKFRDWGKSVRLKVGKVTSDSWRVEGIDWVPISGESAVWLDRPFSEEEDLMRVFLEFHTNGVINQSTNATFIAYGRLRKVLHKTISSSQGAFVEGRHILDAVLIANEVVDEKRRSGEEGVVFKIDFEKAYDHVD
ncbi:hypothetical protein CK203_015264 [Vitis vinifera]|uniref:Reverse transcriptase domain-containing protein n=1 Tax=Vitis vinifera TaxID=29760 RepID=A0A438JKK3_VITVI|nr:hypothetical protein CK203_015264 [Vitis vinifera]